VADEKQQNQQIGMKAILLIHPLGVEKDRAMWKMNKKGVLQ
jgi:hypothetical protein